MAYATINPRAEGYGSYAASNSSRKNVPYLTNEYIPKDITDTLRPQQTPGQKYLISKLPNLGQYKNNDGKPAYKFGTFPLSDYMGGKRTFPTQPMRSASSLQSMRSSYSKN